MSYTHGVRDIKATGGETNGNRTKKKRKKITVEPTMHNSK